MIRTMVLTLGLAVGGTATVAESPAVIRLVNEVAVSTGVPPALAHSVVMAESQYDCSAYNQGAVGIMQTLPRTARSVGVTGNLRDCRTGLVAGMRYLKQAIEKHGLNCAGISAYNRGIFAKPRCTAYGRKVLRQMKLGLAARNI